MPCFCTDSEEDLDQAEREILKHMIYIIEQIKSVRIRGYDQEILLNATHNLLDDLFFEKCAEKGLNKDEQ